MKNCISEYKFCPTRKWRADYFFCDVKLAIEIEGAIYTLGRHTRGKGYSKDMEKYNYMSEIGITLLRYAPTKIDYNQIERVYKRLAALNG